VEKGKAGKIERKGKKERKKRKGRRKSPPETNSWLQPCKIPESTLVMLLS